MSTKSTKLVIAALAVPLVAFTGTSATDLSEASFFMDLPFSEASVWQNWNGDPDQALSLKNGDSRQLFGINNSARTFAYQPGDTWFIYGGFGQTALSTKVYGPTLTLDDNMHAGVDFVTVPDLSVRAAQSGKVVFVGSMFDQTVIVEHWDGFQTTYGYLEKVNVRQGHEVFAGQELGRSGGRSGKVKSAGRLHFGLDQITENGTVRAINPLDFLNIGNAIVPVVLANEYEGLKQGDEMPGSFEWPREIYLSE